MAHDILLNDASGMTNDFQRTNPRQLKGGCFPAIDIQDILDQPGCVRLRYYFGHNVAGELHIILVGVDSHGEDMTNGLLKEMSDPCPPCGSANALNHD